MVRHSLIPALALTAALALSTAALAASPTSQEQGLRSLAHPSFRAGQNGQVYYRGTGAPAAAEVTTGPVSLDWQALYDAQVAADQGQDTWRLDPVQVARLEGANLGFDPSQDTYTLITKVDLQRYPGTGVSEVLVQHSGRAYMVKLIQPFGPGPRTIWTISSVREITSPGEADRIAAQARIAFEYRGPYGQAVAAWWNQAPRPQNPPRKAGQVYYVQPGDTLWAISVKKGVTLYRLIQLNPSVDANALWVGQVIIIQGSGDVWTSPGFGSGSGDNAGSGTTAGRAVHIVEPGDTLWQIALRYDASIKAIMEANGITDANTLWVGQRLLIPIP